MNELMDLKIIGKTKEGIVVRMIQLYKYHTGPWLFLIFFIGTLQPIFFDLTDRYQASRPVR